MAVGLVALAVSCRRQDFRTVVVHVPEMKNEACGTLIASTLIQQQGIAAANIQVDMSRRTVTVRYDSLQRANKNIEFAVANAGFAANSIPANPEAARNLPPECR
jgi:copper chaperone CopZ